MTFLKDIPATTLRPGPAKRNLSRKPGRDNTKFILAAVGTTVLAILAGVIFKLQTKDGTLVVEVDQPGAIVQVLNDKGEVEITRPGEQGKLTLSVDPGKHRLRIEKDGFKFFAQDFTIESGGKETLKATLEPLTPAPLPRQVETSVPAVPVTSPPRNTAINDPAFQQWMKGVAALPAKRQVDAVAKKLQELNPGFDGNVLHGVENDVVTELTFPTERVTDISPVRALVGLRVLHCSGNAAGPGRLADLSPLDGIKLTHLNCGGTQVSDLSPLKGMPLVWLDFSGTSVSNLTPLNGMRLELLHFEHTKVADLSPLEGMRITSLNCGYTQVSDISPLKNMKLTFLVCWHTTVSDLSPLKGMPLIELALNATQVSNLSPLNGMPLKNLHCAGTKVLDLSPLNGTPLTGLTLTDTRVSDLAPLEGMQLTGLNCTRTAVQDLSPLKAMKLEFFACIDTKVTDLSPLQGMPLKNLDLDFNPKRDTEILRSIKTLEMINTKSAADFWKEVEVQ